jgi:peptidyl-prolyl cis-trans isomerase B (cyclophilin B)
VEGKRFTDEELDKLIQGRMKGQKIPQSQREYYKSVGGVPHLDQNYTVYGEVVTGLDMVDRIAAVKKDERNRPLVDVPMTVKLLKKRECRQLDKILGRPPAP